MAVFAQWRRPRREAWWALLGFSIGFVLISFLLMDGVTSPHTAWSICWRVLVLLAYCAGGGILGYRVFAHASLLATTDGLVVKNPFRGDQEVPWADIASYKIDRLLWLYRTNGSRVIIWVIQKNGVDRAKHRATDADAVVAQLEQLRIEALGTPAPQPSGGR